MPCGIYAAKGKCYIPRITQGIEARSLMRRAAPGSREKQANANECNRPVRVEKVRLISSTDISMTTTGNFESKVM
jgi:hypothetical protein